MSTSLAAARADVPARPERPILVGVVVAELLLVLAGFLSGHPFLAAVAAAGVAFFFIAFRAPDVAWALIWLSVPPNVEAMLGGGSAITLPTEPMMIVAIFAWFLRSVLERNWALPSSPLHLPLAALAGVVLLSATWSVRPLASLKAWVMMGGYVLFGYLYFFQIANDPARRTRWLYLVVLTGAAWGLFGMARVLFAGDVGREAVTVASTYAYGAFRPFFREHGTYGAFLAMLLPAALLAALEHRGRARLLYGVGALCIGLGVLLAFARAGWLSIVVVLPPTLLTWALWRRVTRRVILSAAAVTAAIALILAGVGLGRQVSHHAQSVVSSENMSNLERFNRWTAALEMTRDRPLTGVGYGCFLDAYPSYRTKAIVTEQAFIRMGVHSEPLKMLAEVGVPGLLVTLWFLFAVWRHAMRVFRLHPDPSARVLALAAFAGLATYLVNGFFNAYLVEDKVTIPFWVAIGVIAGLGRGLGDAPAAGTSPAPQPARLPAPGTAG